MLTAILGKRNALDIFHDEERSAVRGSVRVIQARDERMIELRKRSLLGGKALAARRRKPCVAEDLNGNHAAEVLALGKIDDPHATFSKCFQDAVRTKLLEGERLGGVVENLLRDLGDIAVEQ